jgi:hypothetical protein
MQGTVLLWRCELCDDQCEPLATKDSYNRAQTPPETADFISVLRILADTGAGSKISAPIGGGCDPVRYILYTHYLPEIPDRPGRIRLLHQY